MTKTSRQPLGFEQRGQMSVFWRILHLLVARYGNAPMGQTLVALTMIFLNERGMPPTMTELCQATGLPKASVSRYVSWQLSHGLVKEVIDPEDRRRRLLVQTAKGKKEWRWQVKQIQQVFDEVDELIQGFSTGGDTRDARDMLSQMKELTKKAPKREL